jgi:anaerobic selenocysteine-containing dehydrogenase
MKRVIICATAALAVFSFGGFGGSAHAAAAKRVQLTGELIDTWCYVTEIMYGEGTAHHQCAVWCAIGGIPVSILGEDGKVYVILKVEGDDTSVANDVGRRRPLPARRGELSGRHPGRRRQGHRQPDP